MWISGKQQENFPEPADISRSGSGCRSAVQKTDMTFGNGQGDPAGIRTVQNSRMPVMRGGIFLP